MRLIPGKTKVKIELFKGISIWDIIVGTIGIAMVIAVLLSSIPYRFYVAGGIVFLFAGLIVRIDATPNYIYIMHILRHFSYKRNYERMLDDNAIFIETRNKSLEEKIEDFYDDEESEEPAKSKEQLKKEKKEKRKAEAALYKAENKKLKDKKVPEDEKNEICMRVQKEALKRRKLML